MRLTALSVCLGVVLALAGARASEGAPPAGVHYLLRPDPRLCPSPTCGGAWVRRVNHATTPCLDGSYRDECYVALVTGAAPPLSSVSAGNFLARGRLVPADIDDFPGFAAFAVAAAWRPAGAPNPRGPTFRVADNGVRCVTSPCFSLTAAALEGAGRRTLSDVDLSRVGATKADLARAQRAVDGGGLLVTGSVRLVRNAGPAGTGRTLRATQFWLRTPSA